MIGTLLSNRYRIDAKLGEGGMGVVYKAHDTLLDRLVAIKTLSPALLGEEGTRRLMREAQSAAKLTHPNIVGTYDVIEEGDARLIVMEYVEGRTLRDRIPLPWAQAAQIVAQVCRALEYAHARGIVHRDIKPENIIFTADGTPKVMDFGLARSEGRSRLTQTGMLVGTVAYMAPEQALQGMADARSDLYSLGCVLYELITGHPPFEAEDPIATITQHINIPPVAPRFHVSDIPPVLDAIILKLLAKDPQARFRSAEALGAALEQLRGGTAIAAAGTKDKIAGAELVQAVRRGVLVGRDEELRTLKVLLDDAAAGEGRVALVTGQSGVGKTRLVEELTTYAHLRGVRVLSARCYEGGTPYEPVIRMLREHFRLASPDEVRTTLGDYAADLARLVPEVKQKIGSLPESIPLPPEQERARLFESVARLFLGLARSTPLLLFVDDLHLGDSTTLQLLRYLAPAVARERVLLVTAHRGEEADRTAGFAELLRQLRREPHASIIEVKPLNPDQVGDLIRVMAKHPTTPVKFAAHIYEVTEGNPYFIDEVINTLFEQGTLYIKDGQWSTDFDEGARYAEMPVPATIKTTIEARLERLSEECRQVLTQAAVIGRQFRLDILANLTGKDEEALVNLLEQALAARLLREVRVAGEDRYEFTQAMVREVIYEGLSRHRRRRMHLRAAEALETIYGARRDEHAGELADHLLDAGEDERAIPYSLDAARQSMPLFAYEEAVRHYQNAVELLTEAGDERRLAETYAAMGEPQVYLGATAAAVATYERALKIFERRGTSADVALAHRLIGGALQRNWEFSSAVPHLEQALQGLSEETRPADVIHTHLDLARCFAFLGRVADSGSHSAAALNLADRLGDKSLQAAAQVALGLVAHRSRDKTDIETAMSHYQEAVRLAQESGEPQAYYSLGRALNNMAVLRMERGDLAGGLQLMQQFLEVVRPTRDVEQISFALLQVNNANYFLGNSREAIRYAEEALKLPLSPRRRRIAEHRLHSNLEEWEAAAEAARDVLSFVRAEGDLQDMYVFAGYLAWHFLDLGRLEDAREAASDAAHVLASAAEYHLWIHFPRVVEALARGGDYERTEMLCARAAALGQAAGSPLAVAFAAYGRGIATLSQGDAETAVRLLEESQPMDVLRPLEVYRLRALASALARRGALQDVERARDTMRQALSVCEQMGEQRKAEQVRAELAAIS